MSNYFTLIYRSAFPFPEQIYSWVFRIDHKRVIFNCLGIWLYDGNGTEFYFTNITFSLKNVNCTHECISEFPKDPFWFSRFPLIMIHLLKLSDFRWSNTPRGYQLNVKAITNLFLLLDFSRYYPYKVHHNKNRHFDIVNSESPIAESTTSSQNNRIQASHQTWHLWLDNLVFKEPVRYRWWGQTISSPIKRTHTHWRWISHHLGRTSLRPFPSISSRPSSVPSRTPPVREPTRTISMDSVT